MKTETTTELAGDKFERIYQQFNIKFEKSGMCSLHNLLWQIIINEVHSDKTVVLSTNFEAKGQELVFVFDGEKGYNKTAVAFLDSVDHIEANIIASELSAAIWGIDSDDFDRIVNQSF